jgi:hypothetical protein
VAVGGGCNGDGASDIQWRDDAGMLVLWEMDGPHVIANTGLGASPSGWEMA